MSVAAFVTVLLVAVASVPQQALTPEDVARLSGVTAAAISPDGQHVAYVRSVPRVPFEDADGPAWAELHVVDRHGASRGFVTGKVNVGSIAWTPDGAGISLLTKRGDDAQRSLYVIPLDGGEARRVLTHETAIGSYSWSPDGTQVAFLASDPAPKKNKKLAEQGFKAEIYEENPRFVRVFVAAADGSGEPRRLELEGSASQLSWSPVGDRLLVALAPTPFIDDSYMNRHYHVVNVDGGEVLAEFETPGKIGSAAWSPDGRHLALIAGADRNDPAEGRLLVAAASGGPLRDLLPGFEGHVTSVAWKDAETIALLGDAGVWTSLWEIRVVEGAVKQVVPPGEMVLSRLSLSQDGASLAVVSDSPRHPPEVFGRFPGDSRPRRLTHGNSWLAERRFAPQEVVEYDARDGLRIEGILIRPLDEQAGVRYPLLVSVHGGPEAHLRQGWLTRYSSPGQVAAAQGYAIFYPNYRGSTGRGVEFSKGGQSDYGGKEFDDVLDGIDHLIATGLVDRDRVGITGGSYGGFATAWCSTYHSERFAAGVMFVGISDQISKSLTTDIPQEMYFVHARRKLTDSWDFYRERSPVYHAEKCRTPLLIMHGKNDPRVHPSQSLEMYRILKNLDQSPVRLVWYPGEGHGNRNAAARYDYNLRMMRWFDHYLKGAGGEPPAPDLAYPLEEQKPQKDE